MSVVSHMQDVYKRNLKYLSILKLFNTFFRVYGTNSNPAAKGVVAVLDTQTAIASHRSRAGRVRLGIGGCGVPAVIRSLPGAGTWWSPPTRHASGGGLVLCLYLSQSNLNTPPHAELQ